MRPPPCFESLLSLICIQQSNKNTVMIGEFNFRVREMHTTLPQTMIYLSRKLKQEEHLALGFQSPPENGIGNLNTLRFVSVITPTAHHLTKWARIPRLKNKFKSFSVTPGWKKNMPENYPKEGTNTQRPSTILTIAQRIHGTGIFTYMNGWFCMGNVGKYTSRMDGMGRHLIYYGNCRVSSLPLSIAFL